MALLSAGCSAGVAGSPLSRGAPRSPAASSGVLPIAHPLDAAKFLASPCASLSAVDLEQLQASGVPGKADHTDNAPGCLWQVPPPGSEVDVGWVTPQSTGLRALYAQKSYQEYFEPTTVSGYPAVYAAFSDERQGGICEISVGVNDHLYFFARYRLAATGRSAANSTRSCAEVKQAAVDVVANLS